MQKVCRYVQISNISMSTKILLKLVGQNNSYKQDFFSSNVNIYIPGDINEWTIQVAFGLCLALTKKYNVNLILNPYYLPQFILLVVVKPLCPGCPQTRQYPEGPEAARCCSQS